jgi:hypothetical protein
MNLTPATGGKRNGTCLTFETQDSTTEGIVFLDQFRKQIEKKLSLR